MGWGEGEWGEAAWGDYSFRPTSYYLALPTHEYQNSPKFLAWLAAALQPLEDVSICTESLVVAFDVDQAVGVQLDIIGAQVGASRTVSFQPTGGVSPILDDETYRLLLKATIGLNQWDGRMQTIQPLWATLFPGGRIIIQDNLDMSVTVTMSGVLSSIIQDLITHDLIVPRPEGVKVNYEFGPMPFFGFDSNDAFISGFDGGYWAP